MSSRTFTVRVESTVLKRLEKLAKSTGRSRSSLAAEALSDYLDVKEWQVDGITEGVASLDRGETVSHAEVKQLVRSWRELRRRPGDKA